MCHAFVLLQTVVSAAAVAAPRIILDVDYASLTRAERARPELAALHGLNMMECWPPMVGKDFAFTCCTTLATECFSDHLTPERCCPESFEESASILVGLDHTTPSVLEAPFEVDDSCSASWIESGVAAETMRIRVMRSRLGRKVARCVGQRWVHWDGESVQLSRRLLPGFNILDVSSCVWDSVACIHGMGHRFSVAGWNWKPPRSTTMVVIIKGSNTTDQVLFETLPVLRPRPLWKRSASSTPPRPKVQRVGLGRPSLYMLVLDSVSRTILRAMMPLTYEFLTGHAAYPKPRGQQAPLDTPPLPESHEHFEFSRYHTLNFGGTLSQVFPLLYGGLALPCKHSFVEQYGRDSLYNVTSARGCAAFPDGGALGDLQRSGFHLAVSFTDAGFGSIVRDIKWDHVMPYLREVYETHGRTAKDATKNFEESLDYACAGTQLYYQLMLQWNRDVLALYKQKEPIYLHSHMLAAHLKEWGVAMMDLFVRNHLRDAMADNPDLVIAITSDHGTIGVFCDQKAPILHMLVPRSLLRRSPELTAVLRTNSQTVSSPYDLFMTLRHFSGYYVTGQGFLNSRDSDVERIASAPTKPYQEQHVIDVSTTSSFRPRSLFEHMARNRSCVAAGISVEHCRVRTGPANFALGPPLYCRSWDELSEATKAQLSPAEAERARQPLELDKDRVALCNVIQHAFYSRIIEMVNSQIMESDPSGKCRLLTWHKIERLQGEGKAAQTNWVRFSVNEGSPRRIFDARFLLRRMGSAMQLQVNHLSQVTHYRQYERCVPPGGRAEICVCE